MSNQRRKYDPDCGWGAGCVGAPEVWWMVRETRNSPWVPRVFCATHGDPVRQLEQALYGPLNFREGVN